MGRSGALVAEGTGVFAVIWGWLVGRRGVRTWLHGGCCISCCLPSGAGSSSMGLGAGFHLLGHFRGPIPLAWVVYPGRWVNLKVAFARGGGLTWFEARCAWSGRRSQRGARWEEHPGFALVGVHQGRQ